MWYYIIHCDFSSMICPHCPQRKTPHNFHFINKYNMIQFYLFRYKSIQTNSNSINFVLKIYWIKIEIRKKYNFFNIYWNHMKQSLTCEVLWFRSPIQKIHQKFQKYQINDACLKSPKAHNELQRVLEVKVFHFKLRRPQNITNFHIFWMDRRKCIVSTWKIQYVILVAYFSFKWKLKMAFWKHNHTLKVPIDLIRKKK